MIPDVMIPDVSIKLCGIELTIQVDNPDHQTPLIKLRFTCGL